MEQGEKWGCVSKHATSDHVCKMLFSPDAPTYNVKYLKGVERNRQSGKFKSPGSRYSLEPVSLINMHCQKEQCENGEFHSALVARNLSLLVE